MIYDTLLNLNNYISLHPLFLNVINFINSHDLSNIKIGKINIAKDIYALISEYTTDDIKSKFIECHKRYIDIQIITNGIEQIGICNKNECKIIEEYNDEKDLEKLEGKIDIITLRSGYFIIFFPQDGHVPGLKIGNTEDRVKKIVFKVPV